MCGDGITIYNPFDSLSEDDAELLLGYQLYDEKSESLALAEQVEDHGLDEMLQAQAERTSERLAERMRFGWDDQGGYLE